MSNQKLDDFLDNMTQQELQQWEEIELIAMEDEMAQKRIQKMVKKKIKTRNKKISVVAAAICLFSVAVFAIKPVRAELERIFHFVPDIGVVEGDTVYEVEVLCGTLQKDDVTVELKDCYAKGNFILGTILITDTSPYEYEKVQYGNLWYDEVDDNMIEEMYQKYGVTWYHGEKQNKLFFIRSGMNIRQNFRQLDYYIQLVMDKSDGMYHEIAIDGFEERLSFQLKEVKPLSNLKEIGSTVTQNGTSITATAEMTEEGAKINYYAICSEEAKTVPQIGGDGIVADWYYLPHFETEIPEFYRLYYLETKNGDIVASKKSKRLKENGGEAIFEVTEKDFPAIFHYTALSARTEESQSVEIPVPEVGETIDLDIPVMFEYGTVRVLSVEHTKQVKETGYIRYQKETDEYITETSEQDVLVLKVNMEQNQNKRILYNIDIDLGNTDYTSMNHYEKENNVFSKTFEIGFDPQYNPLEQNRVMVTFDEPVYWIEGEYKIPVDLK